MIFTTSDPYKAANERYHKLSNWHIKFVWLPTRITNTQVAWLHRVARRGKYWSGAGWYWEYGPRETYCL